MEKQFILVAKVKEHSVANDLDLLVREKLTPDFAIQWADIGRERQVYQFVIASSKIFRLKALLDETEDYESLELFEFASW